MKTKTSKNTTLKTRVKSGAKIDGAGGPGYIINHNQKLKVKTRVKAGAKIDGAGGPGYITNHNQHLR